MATGVERRKIGDVAPVQTGFAFKSGWFVENGVRLLRNANIHQGFLDWDDTVFVDRGLLSKFSAFSAAEGDIVLTLDRPIVANGLKVARMRAADLPALINQRVARFKLDVECLDADYFYAFLRSPQFLDSIRGHDQSLGVPHISPGQVERVDVPLPPIVAQRCIAEALNRTLTNVSMARRAAEDRLAAAEGLPAAYLRDVFETPDVSRWDELTLGDLVRTPIRTGVSKPGRPTSNKRCLTLSAVRGRTLLLEASKPSDVSDSDAEGNWLQPGCFYVIRGNGNRALVGRGAFAPKVLPDRMLFPDLLFQVDLGEAVDPTFFWCVWCSASVRQEIEGRARTAAGIYKINTSNLSSLPLRLPAIGEQRLIAADLWRRLQAAESVIARCREELAMINAIPASLLRAAFNGAS